MNDFPRSLTLLRNVLAKVPYARQVKGGVWRTSEEVVRIITREPRITPGEFDLAGLPGLIGKDNPVILDIGCNDGTHTTAFLRLFRHPAIYSFEPDPRAIERFKRKVTDERVKLYEVAIADKDGTTAFYMSGGQPPFDFEVLPKGWDQSGSIRKPTGHRVHAPWCRFGETISVETKRLDTWLHEEGIELIDFIWADVQGAEIDLIRGGRHTLRRTRYFYTEYSNEELYAGQPGLKTLIKLLPDFQLVHRFWGDVLFKNKRIP